MLINPEKLPKETKQARILALLAMGCIASGVTYLLRSGDADTYRTGWLIILLGAALAGVVIWVQYRATPEMFKRPASWFEGLSPLPLRSGDVVWVGIDEPYARQIRRFLWIVILLPLVYLGLWIYVDHQFKASPHDPRALACERLVNAVYGFALVGFFIMALFIRNRSRQLLQARLGAEEAYLLYDPGTGEIERHDWSTVLTDKSQLLIGRHLVGLGLPKLPRFPRDPLRGFILARLPRSSYAAPWQLLWAATRRGNLSVIAGTVAVVFCVGGDVLLQFFPQWRLAIRTAVSAWLQSNF